MASTKKKSLAPVTPIQSLALRTSRLAEICDKVDAGMSLTDAVKAEFTATLLSQEQGVNEFLDDRNYLLSRIEAAKQIKKMADEQKRRDEIMLEEMDKIAVELVDSTPNIPFSGTMQKLATAKNPPSVDSHIELTSKSFSNVFDANWIDSLGIEQRFYKIETVLVLKLKEIAEALKNGEELAWASLKQGKRLSIKLKD